MKKNYIILYVLILSSNIFSQVFQPHAKSDLQNADNHPSAIYFVKMLVGNNLNVQKVILAK